MATLTLEENRQKALENIVTQSANILLARDKVVGGALLAIDLRDELTSADALKVNDKLDILKQIGPQKSVLKGAAQALQFTFNTSTNYQANLSFTTPTLLEFGYQIIDSEGNEIVLTTTSTDEFYFGNFYLTKDKSGTNGIMTNADVNLTPYLTPGLVGPVVENVNSNFGPASTTIVKTLTNTPIKKVSPKFTIDITISTQVQNIGTVDELGVIKNANGFTFINETLSVMDYGNNEITLVFSTTPTTSPTGLPIEVRIDYEYQILPVQTVSEEFDGTLISGPSGTNTTPGTFDGLSFVFSKTLANTPVTDSLEIFLNNSKLAVTNRDGVIYSMTIDLEKTRLIGNIVDLKIKTIEQLAENTIRYEYSILNKTQADELLGGFDLDIATFTQTLSNVTVDVKTLIVTLGGVTIATTAFDGVISGSYETLDGSGQGTVTGTIDGDTGALSITLRGQSGGTGINTPSLTGLAVSYDFASASDLTVWLQDNQILNITNVRQDSYAGGTLNVIELNSSGGAIDEPPTILGTYPVKKHQNEQTIGSLLVVTEGLEINPNWVPIFVKRDGNASSGSLTSAAVLAEGFSTNQLVGFDLFVNGTAHNITANSGNLITATGLPATGSSTKFEIQATPQEATKLTDASFKTFLAWMNPDNNDDMIKSVNPNITSDQIENPTDTFPNIELNPFRPATEGEYESEQQAAGFTFDDIFAGNHAAFKQTMTDPDNADELQWEVNNDMKWIYDPDPELENVTILQSDSDNLASTRGSSSPNPTRVSVFTPTLETEMTDFSVKSFFVISFPEPTVGSNLRYETGTNLLQSDASGPFVTLAFRYNDTQLMLNSIVGLRILGLETLRIGPPLEFADQFVSASIESDWWDDVQAINVILSDLITRQDDWRTNNTIAFLEGNGGDYTTTPNPNQPLGQFQNALKGASGETDFIDICFNVSTGRLKDLNDRIATPITTGYSKDLYTIFNSMAGNTIGFVKDVIEDYFSVFAIYDEIEAQRVLYRFYDDAIEE